MKTSTIKVVLAIEVIAAIVFTVLSIITSIRTGARFDFVQMTIMCAALTCGFELLEKREKKEKAEKTAA